MELVEAARRRRRARPCPGSRFVARGPCASTRTRSGRIIAFTSPRAPVVALVARAASARRRGGRSRRRPRDGLGRDQVRDAEEVGHEERRRLLVDSPAACPPARRGRRSSRATRSLIVSASSWSCVTNTNVTPTSAWRRLELDLEVLAQARVERAERLVEQEHPRASGRARGRARRAAAGRPRAGSACALLEAAELDERRASRRPGGGAPSFVEPLVLEPEADVVAPRSGAGRARSSGRPC